MQAAATSPWPFLLSRLRRAAETVVTAAELGATGLEPAALLRSGVIQRRPASRWRPAGCEGHCQPNLDLETRAHEGLIGVACPHDPACWPGWQWVARPEMAAYTCRAADVFAAVRDINGLAPLAEGLGEPIVPVGRLLRRGRCLPVVWMAHAVEPFEAICLGLKARLEADGLIVLLSQTVGKTIGVCHPGNIVVLDIPGDGGGDLGLWRALDAIDPAYRRTRITDALAVFDEVTMTLATVPGERHIVRINGHALSGFQHSDLKFIRLLCLAVARAGDTNVEGGGWLEKWRLHGDDKDHDIEALRRELAGSPHPTLAPDELRALIKTSPNRDGRIRLGVHPGRIRFDTSLAALAFVADRATGSKGKPGPTPGAERLAHNRRTGLKTAEKLLKAARATGLLPVNRGDGGEAAAAIPEQAPNSAMVSPIP